jgi:hypothetical protein
MKQFIVIESSFLNDSPSHFIVNDLESLIKEMYESELLNGVSFEQVNEWFKSDHIIYEIEGTIKELN